MKKTLLLILAITLLTSNCYLKERKGKSIKESVQEIEDSEAKEEKVEEIEIPEVRLAEKPIIKKKSVRRKRRKRKVKVVKFSKKWLERRLRHVVKLMKKHKKTYIKLGGRDKDAINMLNYIKDSSSSVVESRRSRRNKLSIIDSTSDTPILK